MISKTFEVRGMTCEHCVTAVRAEVGEVAGVADVTVDLAGGQVTVSGDGFADADVRAAVDEAGYEIVA